jgi:Domain of Unknown Function with PDB structure (DUF3857)
MFARSVIPILLFALLATTARADGTPDATILYRELTFTVDKDGSVTRREHQRVRLDSRRAISAFADPRIPYREGRDEVVIEKAVTHTADGGIVPVPEYSLNVATPGDIAGWPRYAKWRERIVSFSGIEEGVVLELAFSVKEGASGPTRLSRDLRIAGKYPVTEMRVVVDLPDTLALRNRVDHVTEETCSSGVEMRAGRKRYFWTFRNLPGVRDEPGAPAWQARAARLRFSTGGDAEVWAAGYLKLVRQATEADEGLLTFAGGAGKPEMDLRERLAALTGKFSKSFHLVGSAKALTPPECRNAPEVFAANYGNRLEAAAVVAAAVRNLGCNVKLLVAVDPSHWRNDLPVDSGFLGVYLEVSEADAVILLDPLSGPVDLPPARPLRLFGDSASSRFAGRDLLPRGGEIEVTGELALEDAGTVSGELSVTLKGACLGSRAPANAAAQEKLVKEALGRVMPGLEVKSQEVLGLSPSEFRVRVRVEAKLAKQTPAGVQVLRLQPDLASAKQFPLPLASVDRTESVAVPLAFAERVDLTVSLSRGVSLLGAPSPVAKVQIDGATALQTVEVLDGAIHIVRLLSVSAGTLSPADFESLRTALNAMRSEAGRTFLFE